jgi:hypothetical protein
MAIRAEDACTRDGKDSIDASDIYKRKKVKMQEV